MTRIIAGRFQTSEQSDHAVRVLTAHGVARDRISVFYVTSPGQHDATPVGGDEQKSEGLEHAAGGAGVGAAAGLVAGVAGALIGATAGLAAPVVAAAGIATAAAGAYGGSLAGAMGASHDPGKGHIRHAGMMVAVDTGETNADVVGLLADAGAIEVEEATGTWSGGTWEDFDPTSPPAIVDGPRVGVSNPDANA